MLGLHVEDSSIVGWRESRSGVNTKDGRTAKWKQSQPSATGRWETASSLQCLEECKVIYALSRCLDTRFNTASTDLIFDSVEEQFLPQEVE